MFQMPLLFDTKVLFNRMNHLEDNDMINYREWWLLFKIDDEGELEWSREYEMDNVQFSGYCRCVERLRFDEDNMIIAGGGGRPGTPVEGKLLHINRDGEENWRQAYDVIDDFNVHRFRSVVEGRDGSIVAAGYGLGNGEGGVDGCLLKFAQIVNEPEFLRWSPLDTMQTVLPGDSLQFIVVAQDQQEDSLSYLWIMGEDTLASDTTVTILFEELGLFNVQCQVSDGNSTVAITWHVSVVEFYISGFTPEEQALIVRRRSEVEFSVDIRAVEGVDPDYNWILTRRNQQQEEVGEEPEVSILFNEGGQHRLEAQVSHEDESDEVTWIIDVRSAIWSWWPRELDLSTYVDSTFEFIITPFNEDSDSLVFNWFLDDQMFYYDSSRLELRFPENGQHFVTSITHDGIEVDTVIWTVEIEEWSFTTDLMDLTDLPTSPVLYPASPNPFNSSVKLSVYLPVADYVLLSVFDVRGREVSRLVDGTVSAGNKTFVWDASVFPTGVYVVRMDAGDVSEMRKVVLVR